MSYNPTNQLASELKIPATKITAVLSLLAEGNTIPFIARYRKEATGSLDEVQIRDIMERSTFLKEIEDRKTTIIKTIESQGKLTDELRKQILACTEKNSLEDLYLPYKPKRRTKATIAKEKGLEPLAQLIIDQPLDGDLEKEAEKYINEKKEVANIEDALAGARHIVAEWFSENAAIRSFIRELFLKEGVIRSDVRKDHKDKDTKFNQYYEYSELISKIPSHRYLAIRRGEQELVLDMHFDIDIDRIHQKMEELSKLNSKSPFSNELKTAIIDSYKRLIAPSVETDIRVDLKMRSDEGAVEVFAQNLGNLLLSPPMGGKKVIGIDPGFRTGCKCAVVSQTGKFLDNMTLYLMQSASALTQTQSNFLKFVKLHNPEAIAVGNGTASRETESFVKEALKSAGIKDIIVIQVSETGASVYSASDVAREEFADLDLTIRGAISIARRLQDPLAELVKVEPKSLGVGQYQHDVYQPLLDKKLHDVVETCVNKVGVDINTASASLLSYVAGIGPSLSKKIVKFRDENGAFAERKQLKKIPGLGDKAFQQSAGFLRIRGGKNPLDASAVHPERYELVTTIAKEMGCTLPDLIGNTESVDRIEISNYTSDAVGSETLRDIISELKKPGRDPRKSFEMPKFRDDVTKIEDLQKGMVLEGIVTNVTAFGAFVDVGVHQDGLVHISHLSNHFIKDPNEVVKTGDKIKVEVLDVNIGLKRISLSAQTGNAKPSPRESKGQSSRQQKKFTNNPFGNL